MCVRVHTCVARPLYVCPCAWPAGRVLLTYVCVCACLSMCMCVCACAYMCCQGFVCLSLRLACRSYVVNVCVCVCVF